MLDHPQISYFVRSPANTMTRWSVDKYRCRAVARSIYEARRRENARLTGLVEHIAAEPGVDPELDRRHRTLVANGRALRGVPAIGKDSNGSAIYGTQPGFGLFETESRLARGNRCPARPRRLGRQHPEAAPR
jgi:hypothetical protein